MSKEIKTAILVLSGIALLIFGIKYLRGENIFGSSEVYYAEYDNVEGLVVSTPVTINGLNVGKVANVSFKDDNSGKIIVKFVIESDYKFSKNSKAEVYDAGLIGGKALAIIPVFDKAEIAKSGDTLVGATKSGITAIVEDKLTPLQDKIEGAMGSADKLLINLNDVLDEKTKSNLKNSIAGLTATIASFKGTSQALNKLIKSNQDKLGAVLNNAEVATNNLSKVTNSLSQTDLGATVNKLESTLNTFDNVLANLQKGKGSMGKLLNDDKLYTNLEGATKELEALLIDFKLHPKRYTRILSKKEIPYQAPQN